MTEGTWKGNERGVTGDDEVYGLGGGGNERAVCGVLPGSMKRHVRLGRMIYCPVEHGVRVWPWCSKRNGSEDTKWSGN